MLIVDEPNKREADEDEEIEEDEKIQHKHRRQERDYDRRPPQKRHSCGKAFGCFILFLIIICAIVYVSFRFFIGPVVSAVDNLPSDFTGELVLYNPAQAKIKIQTPEEKARTESILNIIPNWLSAPFLNFFSTDPKTQLAAKTDSGIKLPDKINISEFKNYLQNDNLKNLTTVSASWININRKKEELADFYRKQLVNKGFQMRENVSDYNIDLGFWKDNVFGIIKINDSASGKGASDANITINY